MPKRSESKSGCTSTIGLTLHELLPGEVIKTLRTTENDRIRAVEGGDSFVVEFLAGRQVCGLEIRNVVTIVREEDMRAD